MLAAERHRLKTGAWPESIAVLDPEILPSARVDPFTGQAYRMEPPRRAVPDLLGRSES